MKILFHFHVFFSSSSMCWYKSISKQKVVAFGLSAKLLFAAMKRTFDIMDVCVCVCVMALNVNIIHSHTQIDMNLFGYFSFFGNEQLIAVHREWEVICCVHMDVCIFIFRKIMLVVSFCFPYCCHHVYRGIYGRKMKLYGIKLCQCR